MTTTKVAEINCETGEVIERLMTSEEIIANEKMNADYLERKAQAEIEAQAKAAAKASAESKLAALGLTPEEIAALR